MTATNAAAPTEEQSRKVGNPNWFKGMAPASPGRKTVKTYASFMELRNKLQLAMKHRYAMTDYDPVIAMAEIGCDVSMPAELRLKAHEAVARYVYPTLKQIEVTGKDGGAIETKTNVVDNLLGMMMAGQMQLPAVIDAVIKSELAETVGEGNRNDA